MEEVIILDFCKCGSFKKNDKCTNAHCPEQKQKSKGWIVDGTSINFRKAVSFEEASGIVKRMNDSEKNYK